jgi:predicted HTH transcriptional regulator
MTTEKFEELIEAQTEKTNLDFKQDCSWEVTRFAKHLLAMSNLKDGGYIVIGIDNNFVRQGVSQSNINTYKIDIMKDQITQYAEPSVDFEIYKPIGKDKKDYVVLLLKIIWILIF